MVILATLLLLGVGSNSPKPYTAKMVEATCGTCHPLDPVEGAHLSRADWSRELEKMEAMGARIKNRRLLLDYLTTHYGPQKNASPALPVQ